MNLAELLTRELATKSYRDLEAQTGVSHTAIQRIAKGALLGYPDIDTLEKLAQAFSVPLWRLLEIAGVDLNLPSKAETLVTCVASLIQRSRLHQQLYERIVDAEEADLVTALHYLELCALKAHQPTS